MQGLGLGKTFEFDDYISHIENLMNFQQEKLLKTSFSIFDLNEDKVIDELDLFALARIYDEAGKQDQNIHLKLKADEHVDDDDDVFIKSFSYDICTLADELKKKQLAAGITDTYKHDTLISLDMKIKKQQNAKNEPNPKMSTIESEFDFEHSITEKISGSML